MFNHNSITKCLIGLSIASVLYYTATSYGQKSILKHQKEKPKCIILYNEKKFMEELKERQKLEKKPLDVLVADDLMKSRQYNIAITKYEKFSNVSNKNTRQYVQNQLRIANKRLSIEDKLPSNQKAYILITRKKQ